MINEITAFTSDELTSIEEYKIFKFITLGKLLCYKEGTPTILSEQEIMDHMGLPLDAVKSILKLFEKRDFIKIVKKDNQTLYQYTKKADEFGEAFYPLLVWALKYMHV